MTDMERAFVSAYFSAGCSISGAAHAMGKEPNDAHKLMRRRVVRDAIERKHARFNMGANEVISRLASQARCTLDDVLDDAGEFDLPKARKTGAIHQVKRLKVKTETWTDKQGEDHVERTMEVEMESRQGALGLLARYHALLTDNVALRGIPTDERTLKALILSELQRVSGALPPAAARLLDELTPFAVRVVPENFRPSLEAERVEMEKRRSEQKTLAEGAPQE